MWFLSSTKSETFDGTFEFYSWESVNFLLILWILLFTSIGFYRIEFTFLTKKIFYHSWYFSMISHYSSIIHPRIASHHKCLVCKMGNLINQVHERRFAITHCLQLFKLMPLLPRITSVMGWNRICHVENQAIALKYAKHCAINDPE